MLFVQYYLGHEQDQNLPVNFPGKKTVLSQYPEWKAVNAKVMLHGPVKPTRLFEHSLQTVYCIIKKSVDSGSQMKSLIRSRGVKVGWEPRVVLDFVKTLAQNAFVSWRLPDT